MRLVCGLLAAVLLVGCDAGDGARPFGAAPAEGLDLRAELSATEIPLLGDLTLTLDLFVADGKEVEFEPAIPEGFDGDVRTLPAVSIDGGAWTRFELNLQPLQVGELTIAPFVAKDDDQSATTPEFVLTVGSVLEGADADVEAPAPLFPSPFRGWWWIGAGALGLVLLLVAIWWLRRRRAQRPEPASTPLPPHVRALRELTRLRGAPRRTQAEVEVFYVDVSQVLRVYLEDGFGLRAPERTTEEFLPEVERSGVLDATQRAHLRQFLEQCDLVKFAAMYPADDVHTRTFQFAEDLVESTRPDQGAAREPVAAGGEA